MFAYKHTETIEYIKKFLRKTEVLGLRMKKFYDIIFIWIRAYRGIFKSALVYL